MSLRCKLSPGFVLACTLLLFFSKGEGAYAQTANVSATGSWDMANMTVEKAKTLALERAKEEALRRAGIPEEFIVVNTGNISDKFTRFTSYSNSELKGEILSYDILQQSIQNEGKRYFYSVEIKAKVRTGKVKRDLEFVASVEGIKNTPYHDGELFSFSVTPHKNCYTTIFWFDGEGQGAIVYPNSAEPAEQLEKNKTYVFPRTQNYKTRKETKELMESISIVFVFTKKNIPFTEVCTFETIQQWITMIPSNERYLNYNAIVITN